MLEVVVYGVVGLLMLGLVALISPALSGYGSAVLIIVVLNLLNK